MVNCPVGHCMIRTKQKPNEVQEYYNWNNRCTSCNFWFYYTEVEMFVLFCRVCSENDTFCNTTCLQKFCVERNKEKKEEERQEKRRQIEDRESEKIYEVDIKALRLWFSQAGLTASKSNSLAYTLVRNHSITLKKLKILHENSSFLSIFQDSSSHLRGYCDELEIKMITDLLNKKNESKSISIPPPPPVKSIPKAISVEEKELTKWFTQAGLSGDRATGLAKFLVDKFAMTLIKMDLHYSDGRWSKTMEGYSGIDSDDKTLICNALEKRKKKNHLPNTIPMSDSKIFPPPNPKNVASNIHYDQLTLWLTQANLSNDKAANFAKFLVDNHSMTLKKMDIMYNEGKLNIIISNWSSINNEERSFLAAALEKRKTKNEKYKNI